MTRARLRSVILSLGQRFTARPLGFHRDQVVPDRGDLLHEVLAGRIVPAVNGVGLVGHTRSRAGKGLYLRLMPRRSSKKDSPVKLASRMKRRWRVVLLRAKGEILGTVEAPDVAAAKAGAAVQFDLDEIQRDRIMVQELA